MLRQDFLSKIIEQIVQVIARALKMDHEQEAEKFLENFDQILLTYYKINQKDLTQLTETNQERDAFLLDEKLRNFQLQLFVKAGLAYFQKNEILQAKNCLSVIERIQQEQITVFEFPSQGQIEIQQWIKELQLKIDKTNSTNT